MSEFVALTKERLLVLRKEDILGMRENPHDDPPCVQVFFRFSSFRGSTSNPAFITVTPEEGKEIYKLLCGESASSEEPAQTVEKAESSS